MEEKKSNVEIGYLEKAEPHKLESRFFPSKVGGKPAWLNLKNISVDTTCGVCSDPCVFLCQIYAPVQESENAYHRMIYVFVCKNPDCCDTNKNNNFVVLRCQLPKQNIFYPPEEPDDTPEWHPNCRVENFNPLCIVCGCWGSFRCSNCKKTNYCSKAHQILDWKSGHKVNCNTNSESSVKILFKEFEIKTEPEMSDNESESESENEKRAEDDKIKEYEELVKIGKAGTLSHVPDSLLERYVKIKEDKYFEKFKSVINLVPYQVIRYERGGSPLWISKPNDNEEIPDCENCHSPREFEFQILPTLLNYLDSDSLEKSIDWGTLLVFTCVNSCDQGPAYKKEFLLKQDVS